MRQHGPKNRLPCGAMISGRGSNLQALLDACAEKDFPAEIRLVISNVPGVQGLERARAAGVPTRVIDHRNHEDRESFEAAVTAAFEEAGVETILMAGFMRIVTDGFVRHWQGRLINIHPALLPLYPGLDTHARALADGVKLHGCTVHFVEAEVDSGPIIGQAAVPVLPGDTPDSLAARVLTAEHRLYPACLSLIASGGAKLDGNQVMLDPTSVDGEARLRVPSGGA